MGGVGGALFCPGPEREKEAASSPKAPKRGRKEAPVAPSNPQQPANVPRRSPKSTSGPLQHRGATKPQWGFYWLVALEGPPVP